MAFRLNDAPTLERPRRRIEAPISNRQWRAPDITSVGRVRLGKNGVGTNSVGRNAIGQVDTLGGDVQILEKKVGEGFSAVWKARNDGDTPGEARLRLLDEGSQEITTGPTVIVEPGEEADLTLEFTPPGDPDEVLYQLEFAGARPQWHLFVISYFEAKWEAALVDAGFTEKEVPFTKTWEDDLDKAVDLKEHIERLRLQKIEDKRLADAEEKRLKERREADKRAQAKAAAEQAAFWLKSETARKQALRLEEIRIAEEAARIPVIVPHGTLRVSPNLHIAAGGAKDIMDVNWGYKYVSGPPHIFVAMKVMWKGRTDQMPVHHSSPGQTRANMRHRIGAGIFPPGTHSVTAQIISSPTDRNVFTVRAESTVTFTIPEPLGYRKNSEQMGNELGWAVYKQGMGKNEYGRKWREWFSGKNMRVTQRWIDEWYAGAKVGKRGKKMREGQLGYDRQPGLRAP
jgi:hypothetical protein